MKFVMGNVLVLVKPAHSILHPTSLVTAQLHAVVLLADVRATLVRKHAIATGIRVVLPEIVLHATGPLNAALIIGAPCRIVPG